MTKPRIFVSSTYYDLTRVRSSLESLIDSLGYEAVLFDNRDVAFRHDQPLDRLCHEEIRACHVLVLIVGGRCGDAVSSSHDEPESRPEKSCEKLNAITLEEYEAARDREVPIFICVEKHILADYEAFKKNRPGASVNDEQVNGVSVFQLLDAILRQELNHFVRPFEKFDDISFWLRDQWAGLFADLLLRKQGDASRVEPKAQTKSLPPVEDPSGVKPHRIAASVLEQ